MEKHELKLLLKVFAGRSVFVGELPEKMQVRGSQQTGCLLFTVVEIDSVRPAFEARDSGGLYPVPPPYPLPVLRLGHSEPTNKHQTSAASSQDGGVFIPPIARLQNYGRIIASQ